MPEPSHSALLAYVQAWSAQDPGTAETLLAKCWTEESEIVGPGYYFKGLSSVLNEIKRFHKEQPGCKAIATSAFDTHGQWTRFEIAMVDPEGTRTHEGSDIVEQDGEGKIRRVITFWGPVPRLRLTSVV